MYIVYWNEGPLAVYFVYWNEAPLAVAGHVCRCAAIVVYVRVRFLLLTSPPATAGHVTVTVFLGYKGNTGLF